MMKHESTENKDASPVQTPRRPEQNKRRTLADELRSESEEEQMSGPAVPTFSHSLNEELEEHLNKNPRRFFGGCGG
jgi:hypothetical protein